MSRKYDYMIEWLHGFRILPVGLQPGAEMGKPSAFSVR
jgi:hypothetical protein